MMRIARVLAVAALMTLLLGQMIADRMMLLRDGTVIELQVTPVDPRSLFRGDYVILGYPISIVDVLPLEGDKGFNTNEPIFLTLSFDGSEWTPVAAHKKVHQVKTGEVVIAGRIDWRQTRKCGPIPDTSERECQTVEEMRITYGIESFFVPEGVGKALEDKRNEGKMRVRIAVDEKGRAGIKSVLVDGEVIHEETLF